jgi:hypothetical protein
MRYRHANKIGIIERRQRRFLFSLPHSHDWLIYSDLGLSVIAHSITKKKQPVLWAVKALRSLGLVK